MKRKFAQLKAIATRAHDRAARAALLPFVVLTSSPAFAELPTVTAPGTGIGGAAVSDGDWLGQMGAWFKAGLTILGLVLAGLAFIYVVSGALSKWRAYSLGRADIADLKEYFIMGAVVTVFVVVMVTTALKVFA